MPHTQPPQNDNTDNTSDDNKTEPDSADYGLHTNADAAFFDKAASAFPAPPPKQTRTTYLAVIIAAFFVFFGVLFYLLHTNTLQQWLARPVFNNNQSQLPYEEELSIAVLKGIKYVDNALLQTIANYSGSLAFKLDHVELAEHNSFIFEHSYLLLCYNKDFSKPERKIATEDFLNMFTQTLLYEKYSNDPSFEQLSFATSYDDDLVTVYIVGAPTHTIQVESDCVIPPEQGTAVLLPQDPEETPVEGQPAAGQPIPAGTDTGQTGQQPATALPNSQPTHATAGQKVKVVIVIDDMGESISVAKQLAQMNLNITFSVWPFSSHAKAVAELGHKSGRTILIHQPMQPMNSKMRAGPHVIHAGLSAPEIRQIIQTAIKQVPYAIGLNNHMGSKATQDVASMQVVADVLKNSNFILFDSMTHPKSIFWRLGLKAGLPTYKRDVFLDNVDDKNYILKQLEETIAVARKQGHAIAIGHPLSGTVAALLELEKRNYPDVEFVPINALAPLKTR